MSEMLSLKDMGPAINDCIKMVPVLAAKLLGPLCEEAGLILQDKMKYYRYKNLNKIADKVSELQKQRKLDGKTNVIPPKIALPVLEFASLEEEETIQDIWAKLITNAMDPNFKEPIHPAYIEVIKQLSSDEAVVLQKIKNAETFSIICESEVIGSIMDPISIEYQSNFSDIRERFRSRFAEFLKYPERISHYLDNLLRLMLIELKHYDEQRIVRKKNTMIIDKNNLMHLCIETTRKNILSSTEFGKNFMVACC